MQASCASDTNTIESDFSDAQPSTVTLNMVARVLWAIWSVAVLLYH